VFILSYGSLVDLGPYGTYFKRDAPNGKNVPLRMGDQGMFLAGPNPAVTNTLRLDVGSDERLTVFDYALTRVYPASRTPPGSKPLTVVSGRYNWRYLEHHSYQDRAELMPSVKRTFETPPPGRLARGVCAHWVIDCPAADASGRSTCALVRDGVVAEA